MASTNIDTNAESSSADSILHEFTDGAMDLSLDNFGGGFKPPSFNVSSSPEFDGSNKYEISYKVNNKPYEAKIVVKPLQLFYGGDCEQASAVIYLEDITAENPTPLEVSEKIAERYLLKALEQTLEDNDLFKLEDFSKLNLPKGMLVSLEAQKAIIVSIADSHKKTLAVCDELDFLIKKFDTDPIIIELLHLGQSAKVDLFGAPKNTETSLKHSKQCFFERSATLDLASLKSEGANLIVANFINAKLIEENETAKMLLLYNVLSMSIEKVITGDWSDGLGTKNNIKDALIALKANSHKDFTAGEIIEPWIIEVTTFLYKEAKRKLEVEISTLDKNSINKKLSALVEHLLIEKWLPYIEQKGQ